MKVLSQTVVVPHLSKGPHKKKKEEEEEPQQHNNNKNDFIENRWFNYKR